MLNYWHRKQCYVAVLAALFMLLISAVFSSDFGGPISVSPKLLILIGVGYVGNKLRKLALAKERFMHFFRQSPIKSLNKDRETGLESMIATDIEDLLIRRNQTNDHIRTCYIPCLLERLKLLVLFEK